MTTMTISKLNLSTNKIGYMLAIRKPDPFESVSVFFTRYDIRKNTSIPKVEIYWDNDLITIISGEHNMADFLRANEIAEIKEMAKESNIDIDEDIRDSKAIFDHEIDDQPQEPYDPDLYRNDWR